MEMGQVILLMGMSMLTMARSLALVLLLMWVQTPGAALVMVMMLERTVPDKVQWPMVLSAPVA